MKNMVLAPHQRPKGDHAPLSTPAEPEVGKEAELLPHLVRTEGSQAQGQLPVTHYTSLGLTLKGRHKYVARCLHRRRGRISIRRLTASSYLPATTKRSREAIAQRAALCAAVRLPLQQVGTYFSAYLQSTAVYVASVHDVRNTLLPVCRRQLSRLVFAKRPWLQAAHLATLLAWLRLAPVTAPEIDFSVATLGLHLRRYGAASLISPELPRGRPPRSFRRQVHDCLQQWLPHWDEEVWTRWVHTLEAAQTKKSEHVALKLFKNELIAVARRAACEYLRNRLQGILWHADSSASYDLFTWLAESPADVL